MKDRTSVDDRDADLAPLQKRLGEHVHALADAIGERNVWRPEALELAAVYLDSVLGSPGAEEPPFFQTNEMGSLVYARGLSERGELVSGMFTGPFRYAHYHSKADTADKIDYEPLTRLVAGLSPAVAELAKPVSKSRGAALGTQESE